MASSSCSTPIRINFHHGGVFEANPINYEFDMVSKLDNVDIYAMDYSIFVTYLETISHAMSNALEYALRNNGEIDVYMAHSKFDFDDRIIEDSHHSGSDEDDYDIYDIYSSDEDDTASLDHLSDGEDEIVGVRTQKPEPKNKKKIPVMFDDTFLATIFNGLDKDKYVENNVVLNDEMNPEDEDRLGKLWPIHDPKTKWKLMRPVLGERFEGPDQLKRCLPYFALFNGYKLYYEVNDGKRLLTRCSRNADGKPECTYRMWASWMQKERSFQVKSLVDEHCCSRIYEFGTLITCNWIARNNAKKIMTNPSIKVKKIQSLILKKYKCKVTIGQVRRGKIKALDQYETCLEDHYGVLYRNLFWKAAKCTFPAKFEEVMQEIKSISGDAYKHFMDKNLQSWSRAFFTTDRACDAVENGISECFNSLIVDARRKHIINMLEDIRTYIMERMKKMKDKHLELKDEICPNIRKKIEIIKDKHRNWRVIPSGKYFFEVRNGFEAFRVDEKNKTCTCRQWQLTGIPCAHGFAAIYFLHKNPDAYVSDWYKTPTFGAVYNHFIIPLTGMLQWPTTNYQKPLPPIARRMPERPPTKRKRDASEGNDRNRNRLSRVGRIIHCKKCGKEGHNRASCDKRSATHIDGATNGSTDNNDGPSAVNDDSNATITKSKSKDESGFRGGLRITDGSTSRGVERKLFVIEQPISLASPTDSEYLRSGKDMIHNERDLSSSELTPPYTPQHNGVSESRNRTLLDMVRSMINLTTLPLSFWD
ncbi:hypothetical protein Tco_0295951 [Tanacetum coccineum]